jgi:hypothetical protein
MPAAKFEKLLLKNGDLELQGDFATHGDVIGEVTVCYVLIPDRKDDDALTDPITGTVTFDVPTRDGDSDSEISKAFKAKIVGNKFELEDKAKVRGIGIAVAVKRSKPPVSTKRQDPPAFETFTWCVNLEVEA